VQRYFNGPLPTPVMPYKLCSLSTLVSHVNFLPISKANLSLAFFLLDFPSLMPLPCTSFRIRKDS
jgi:hypothetical protein